MKTRSTPIPIYIMEEHHQAFYLWHSAIQKEELPKTGNLLIHIDAHADLEPPVVRKPFSEFEYTHAGIKEFTNTELGIENFIVPAVHQGIFSSYVWIHPDFDSSGEKECSPGVYRPVYSKKQIRTYENKGQVYILSNMQDKCGPEIKNKKENRIESKKDKYGFDCWSGTIHAYSDHAAQVFVAPSTGLAVNSSAVLDIDLDYFSLSQHDYRDLSIEITEDEYNNIKNNPHHFMRLDGRNFLEKRNEKYYLCMNKKQGMHIRSSTQVSMERIEKRVKALQRFIQRIDLNPSLIHICRSKSSGYTPAHQCMDIEKMLLEMLAQEFQILGVLPVI